MFGIFLATYGAVFVAEIVGDKLLYTTGVLAARYRTLPIMFGMAFAFMLKMAVAVAVGEAISKLPPLLVAGVTAASFIGVAITRLAKRRAPLAHEGCARHRKAAMVSFAAIFFSEWGDVGQITAAAMSAKYHVPAGGLAGRRVRHGDQRHAGRFHRRGRARLDSGARAAEDHPLRRRRGAGAAGILSVSKL